jgi:hypothetical protein
MADDEDKKHSNTDRLLKPSEQKSRPNPLPRGVMAGPSPAVDRAPSPSPSPGGGGRSRPPGPTNGGAPPKDPGGPGRGGGPSRPSPDFNAAAEKSLTTEFNKQSGVQGQSPERPRISQSDYAKAFRQASTKTQNLQQGKDRGLE